MKRKLFIAFMVVFTILLAIILFASLISGAPVGRGEMGRYIVGAAGISLLLPTGFTVFFFLTLHLSERVQKKDEEKEKQKKEEHYVPTKAQILTCMNSLVEEKQLTPEERDRLLSHLKEL